MNKRRMNASLYEIEFGTGSKTPRKTGTGSDDLVPVDFRVSILVWE